MEFDGQLPCLTPPASFQLYKSDSNPDANGLHWGDCFSSLHHDSPSLQPQFILSLTGPCPPSHYSYHCVPIHESYLEMDMWGENGSFNSQNPSECIPFGWHGSVPTRATPEPDDLVPPIRAPRQSSLVSPESGSGLPTSPLRAARSPATPVTVLSSLPCESSPPSASSAPLNPLCATRYDSWSTASSAFNSPVSSRPSSSFSSSSSSSVISRSQSPSSSLAPGPSRHTKKTGRAQSSVKNRKAKGNAQTFRCPVKGCQERSFSRKSDVIRHLRTTVAHEEYRQQNKIKAETVPPCPFCGNIFTRIDARTRHIRTCPLHDGRGAWS